MTDDFFPEAPSGRPLWLVTLADLALLLLGFMVLTQAARLDRHALAKGLRDGFGQQADASAPAMPVASSGVAFAVGSANPWSTAELVAWAREAARDPRVAFTITGSTDGSAADIDAPTGSAAVLAADRARAVAAALAPVVPSRRLSILTTLRPGPRAALVTLAFDGEPQRSSKP
ncbi:hypothetical protein SAMN05192583_1648 [Sphingomonas gellani]|uniref:Flagellar motor protein MotB n=1 Tax=Sphingomonas gellani TaxID=1166340 RepID=A0A1H8CME9_9SPHN|nr:hypothetical protein [Sphingomonas gellani]SEM95458.1 hypothetical protein SAMN05192583_1648 [Sphingomonas gellani]